jgi:small subunit ribosomal protein S21
MSLVTVVVHGTNAEQGLRLLKKKIQREGLLREWKRRTAYEKPSEKNKRKEAEAHRRRKKVERKKKAEQ